MDVFFLSFLPVFPGVVRVEPVLILKHSDIGLPPLFIGVVRGIDQGELFPEQLRGFLVDAATQMRGIRIPFDRKQGCLTLYRIRR